MRGYIVGLVVIVAAALFPLSLPHAQDSSRVQRVLLYDCCDGYYEVPKDTLRSALSSLATQKEFDITMSRDQSVFDYDNLKTFDVVVIAYALDAMNLSEQGRTDFERYVREGGGAISVFEVFPVPGFPFLRDSVIILHISQTGNLQSAVVYADSQAFVNPEHVDIFQDLPDSVALEFRWAPYRNQVSVTEPREYLDSANATILLSADLSPQSDSNYPVVWTREVGNGRAAVNMLGHPSSVYAQQDDYLQKLLWNLMEYVAGGEPVSVQPPGQALQAFPRFRLVGRSLALSLAGEGPHVLKVWNTRGELVQERIFRGSGEFHTLLRGKGVLLLRIQGPGGAYQQRIVVEN